MTEQSLVYWASDAVEALCAEDVNQLRGLRQESCQRTFHSSVFLEDLLYLSELCSRDAFETRVEMDLRVFPEITQEG